MYLEYFILVEETYQYGKTEESQRNALDVRTQETKYVAH